jgi:hypothetical protein
MYLDILRALLHLRQPNNIIVSRKLPVYLHPRLHTYPQCYAPCDYLSEWQRLNDLRDRKWELLDQHIRHRLSWNSATGGLYLDRAR